MLLLAKPVAEKILQRVQGEVERLFTEFKRRPTLATILVGEDPASQLYVRRKGEMCHKLGLGHHQITLPTQTLPEELFRIIDELNRDPDVHGILIQKPLPKQFSESEVFERIHPKKDVDCFHPENVGRLTQGQTRFAPCTPGGIMDILSHYKIEVPGQNCLVVGKSEIVGKPTALMLLNSGGTVTTAHSLTKPGTIKDLISWADIVVVAIGKPHFFGSAYPWKKSTTVIDVGINRTPAGKVVGDIDFDVVAPLVKAITPVPGGVGPMTIANLMANTVKAATLQFVTKG